VTRSRISEPITSDRAVRLAMAIADTGGIKALSMRGLAAKLGVEPMSLYHHVKSKDALFDRMIDAVFDKIAVPTPGTRWNSALRTLAESARTVLARHPWASLIDARTTPSTLRYHDAIIGVLRGAGFSIELTAHAMSLLDGYVRGFALHQSLSEHLVGSIPRSGSREFQFGLRLVLDGLDQALTSEGGQCEQIIGLYSG
jgi:AcrR family transcriptional regulator